MNINKMKNFVIVTLVITAVFQTGKLWLQGMDSHNFFYSLLSAFDISFRREEGSVSEFFHILDSVVSVRGTVITAEGKYDITTYSTCINGDKGI